MSEVDAKIAASEARTDTKFTEVMGELRLINQRIGHVDQRLGHLEQRMDRVETSFSAIRLNIWLAAATTIGLVAIFGWGTTMFGTGMDAQSISDQSAKNAIQQVEPRLDSLEKRMGALETQMGTILTFIEGQKKEQLIPAPQ